MMIHQYKLKLIIITTLLFVLTGCVTQQVEEAPKVELFELQKRADTAYRNDDMEASEKDYQILIQEMPMLALNWFRLGNIYVRTNRPDAAVDLYREAIIRDPKYTKAWYNLGIVQLKQTAYSLNEMLLYTDINDPLYDKAKNMLEGIKSIIQQD